LKNKPATLVEQVLRYLAVLGLPQLNLEEGIWAGKGVSMKPSKFVSWNSIVVAGALLWPTFAFAQGTRITTPSAAASGASSAEQAKAESKSDVVCPLGVGTAFNAKLLESLDARRSKPGDKFTAETTETVRYGSSVIFPRGTIIEGHVVRRSTSTQGPDRAALFVQFDKAILKNGQEAAMNAGIQAMAVGPKQQDPVESAAAANEEPEGETSARMETSPRGDVVVGSRAVPAQPLDTTLNEDGSAKSGSARNMMAISREPAASVPIYAPALDLPLTQGTFTKHGLLTSDSKGALGAPDIRIYTPLSEGSNGTVLISTKKNVHLERGTRLLIVIQPPRIDPASK
jgi:hypothetical protein